MLWGTTTNALWNQKKRGRQFYGYFYYFYFWLKYRKKEILVSLCSPAIILIFFSILRGRTVSENAIDLLFPLYQLSDSCSVNNGLLLLHHFVNNRKGTKRFCSSKTFNLKSVQSIRLHSSSPCSRAPSYGHLGHISTTPANNSWLRHWPSPKYGLRGPRHFGAWTCRNRRE